MMNRTAKNMTAKLYASMQKRGLHNATVRAIRNAAPSKKAANAAIKLVFGTRGGGTRRR
jgi:hypothetical protein